MYQIYVLDSLNCMLDPQIQGKRTEKLPYSSLSFDFLNNPTL